MKRVGIVGSGQLARMMSQASIGLGVECVVFAEHQDEATRGIVRGYSFSTCDAAALVARCGLDVITFEHELTPLDAVRELERSLAIAVRPSSGVLALADKAHQRQVFNALGLPVPEFVVGDGRSVAAFGERIGWPIVVKLALGGYDGRGVFVVQGPGELERFAGARVVAEPYLPIEREIAVLVARRPGGETAVYPPVETVQCDGMCREVVAPAPIDRRLSRRAEELAVQIANAIESVGILAIEMFVVDGQIVVNEIAPRVHNSGHFSIEGAETSQFENHLRAVLDWPLGATTLRAPWAVMVNVTGSEAGDPRERVAGALAVPGAHVHLYGKTWRPGRKLGHVTVVGHDLADVRQRAHDAVRALGGEPMDRSWGGDLA